MANVIVTNTAAPAPVILDEPLAGKKYSQAFKVLGICQLVVGGLAIILGIVSVALEANRIFIPTYGLTVVCAGIWTGIFAVAAGCLAIAAGANPVSCPVTGGMIVSIFAAIAAGIMFSIETPAAVYAGDVNQNTTGVHAVLSLLAFTELVLAIIHSAFCCASGCCYTYTGHVVGPPAPAVVTTTTYPGNPVHVTTIPEVPLNYGQQPAVYSTNLSATAYAATGANQKPPEYVP